jgi:hypothetical protein
MSTGWPKANGRFALCAASVCAGRVRALFTLPLRIAAAADAPCCGLRPNTPASPTSPGRSGRSGGFRAADLIGFDDDRFKERAGFLRDEAVKYYRRYCSLRFFGGLVRRF